MNMHRLAARRLLTGSGALIVSFSLAGMPDQAQAQAPAKPLALTEVDRFLAIDAKGMVTVYSGKVDLGTGVATALPQIVAEELDVPLRMIKLVQGDTALTPEQGTTWAACRFRSEGCSCAMRRRPPGLRSWRRPPSASTCAGRTQGPRTAS